MDLLLEHIRRSAEAQEITGARLRPYVESFLKSQKTTPVQTVFSLEPGRSGNEVLDGLHRCLLLEDFHCGKGPDYNGRSVTGYLEHQYDRNGPWLAAIDGLLRKTLDLRFEVEARVEEGPRVTLRTSHHLPTWVEELRAAVGKQLARRTGGGLAAPRKNVVLAPGEAMDGDFSGVLQDYSGCATLEEVQDLVKQKGDAKALPLGIYRFDSKPELAGGGPLLCLGNYRTGSPMMYNGTLIVAPQNSGKTELIVRWTLAANRAGYNTFLVDVKGSLYERLHKEGLQGRVFHFTTDPEPAGEYHRINLLQGLKTATAQGRREIEQLAEALLPDQGAEGEDRERRQLRVNWLSAMINIIKLREFFYRHPDFVADLGMVYEMATREDFLFQVADDIRNAMPRAAAKHIAAPEPGVDYWLNELSVLLSPSKRFPGGQRETRYTYQSLTIFLALALRPFSRIGTLYARTRGRGDFTLKALDSEEQTTIILAAREQDMEDSRTVVSAAIKRLEQILFDRRKQASPARHILLLLDETRRIRAFRAGEYITFARDAKAGVVLVYQSITQIKTDAEIVEILENVGTQIYLRSMVGETARRFIGMLPKRYRPTYSRSKSMGADGQTESLQTGQQEVDYLTTGELYRMPAGEYPAIAYIKDHGPGKPFLVDMDGQRVRQACERLHSSGEPPPKPPARPAEKKVVSF